jgi:hypothetical protein
MSSPHHALSTLKTSALIVAGVPVVVTLASWFGALIGVTVLAAVLGGLAAIGGGRRAPAGPVKTSRCRACGKVIARAGSEERWRDRRGRETCDGFPHEPISAIPDESTAGVVPDDGVDGETATCAHCGAAIRRHRRALWIDAAGEAGCGELRIHGPAR